MSPVIIDRLDAYPEPAASSLRQLELGGVEVCRKRLQLIDAGSVVAHEERHNQLITKEQRRVCEFSLVTRLIELDSRMFSYGPHWSPSNDEYESRAELEVDILVDVQPCAAVEAPGIEPGSANSFPQTSTCVSCLFSFATGNPDRQGLSGSNQKCF